MSEPIESPAVAGKTPALGAQTIGGSLWTGAATLSSAVLSALSTIVVARALGATSFGRYTYVLYVIVLLAKLSDFGVTARGTSVLVSALPAGDADRIQRELRRLLYFGAAKAVVLASAVLVLLRGDMLAAVIAAVSIAVQTCSSALTTAILAQKRFRILSISALAVTATQAVLTSWVALETGNAKLTVSVFLAGQVVAAGISVALTPWAMFRRQGVRHRRADRSDRTLPVQLVFYVSGVGQLIVFGRSETFALSYTHQAAALGLFAVATTISARATLLTDALYGALLPNLGEASTRGDEAVGRAYSTAIRFSASLMLVATVVLAPVFVVYGPAVLGVDGSAVRVAAAVTIAGSLMQSFVYPLTAIAAVELQRRAIALPAVVGAVVDVVFAVTLVPSFGLGGAVTASVLGALSYLGTLYLCTGLPTRAAQTLRSQALRVGGVVATLTGFSVLTASWAHWAALATIYLAVIVAYAAAGVGRGVLVGSDVDVVTSVLVRRRATVSARARRALTAMLLVRRVNADA